MFRYEFTRALKQSSTDTVNAHAFTAVTEATKKIREMSTSDVDVLVCSGFFFCWCGNVQIRCCIVCVYIRLD